MLGADFRPAWRGRLLARRLGEFLDRALAFQPRHVVDEQLAVEMVDLMLQAGGEQALGLDLAALVVAVEEAHADFRGAA